MFFEDSALHARSVAAFRDNLAEVAFGGVKFFVLVRYVLLSMHCLHALWRKQDLLTQEELKDMGYWCDRVGKTWGKLQWGVTPRVHWTVVHNAYFARQLGSLYIFRNVPTEKRNQPFERHLKIGCAVPAFGNHTSPVSE